MNMQDSISTTPTTSTPQTHGSVSQETYRDVQALEEKIMAGMNSKGATTAATEGSSQPKPVQTWKSNNPAVSKSETDSLAIDSLNTVDSVIEGEERSGVILVNEKEEPGLLPGLEFGGISWIYAALLLVFCLVAFRFRNNKKYMRTIFKSLTEIRERHNVFDDTVRETSFLFLLNLLWCCSAGVILYCAIHYLAILGFDPMGMLSFPYPLPTCVAACMGVCMVYELIMWFAYWMVGNVFSDKKKASIWVKGFTSSQGIVGIVFFPLALLCLSYPAHLDWWLISSLVAFILGKICFLWKGFRIFFTQFSSWVLFLYYLCSLEVIPLILTYLGAAALCRFILLGH